MYKFISVRFPFTEKAGKKTRPALLLTNGSYGKHRIVVVTYVTSKPGDGIESEVEVGTTAENGLTKKSVIKLHKLANISESTIKGQLGELSIEKSVEVKTKLKRLFQL